MKTPEKELQIQFKSSISLFSLRFKDPIIEKKFDAYKLSAPHWLNWLTASLVFLIIFRRFHALYQSLTKPESTFVTPSGEAVILVVLITFANIEIATLRWKQLSLIRGCPILLASFFTASYSSYKYFPNKFVFPSSYFSTDLIKKT